MPALPGQRGFLARRGEGGGRRVAVRCVWFEGCFEKVDALGWRTLKRRERRGPGELCFGVRGSVRACGPPEGGTPYEALRLGGARGGSRQGCRCSRGLGDF